MRLITQLGVSVDFENVAHVACVVLNLCRFNGGGGCSCSGLSRLACRGHVGEVLRVLELSLFNFPAFERR